MLGLPARAVVGGAAFPATAGTAVCAAALTATTAAASAGAAVRTAALAATAAATTATSAGTAVRAAALAATAGAVVSTPTSRVGLGNSDFHSRIANPYSLGRVKFCVREQCCRPTGRNESGLQEAPTRCFCWHHDPRSTRAFPEPNHYRQMESRQFDRTINTMSRSQALPLIQVNRPTASSFQDEHAADDLS